MADWRTLLSSEKTAEIAQTAPVEGSQSQRFYRPELDSLRFFAFLGVFIFHVVPNEPSFYQKHSLLSPAIARMLSAISGAGAFGVDLFFALSAYLITVLLIREEAVRGTIDVRAFYVRRILRIWPLYFFFVAVAVVVSRLDPGQQLSWHYIAGYLLLAGNWVYVWKGLPHSIAGPLWSVSIEEQFYLTWPITLRRLSRKQLVLVVVVLLLIANLVRAYVVFSHGLGGAIEYDTFTRMDAIALGILVAYFLGGRVPSLSFFGRIALAAASLFTWCMVAAHANLNAQTEVAPVLGTLIGRPLVALAAAGLLVSVIGAPAAGIRVLVAPWLTYLGRISYGLYVYHAAGLFLAGRLFGTHSVKQYAAFAATGFALTVAMSSLSYRWLETPFLRMKERFAVVRSRPI